MTFIFELVQEAVEIIRNARAAALRGDITPAQAREVVLNTMQDVATQIQK